MIGQVPLCPERPSGRQDVLRWPRRSGIRWLLPVRVPIPLVVPEPGQPPAAIYLTDPYDGAPFGLSIVVPLHVGPFVLPTQRVRAKIEVDPLTAQITVTTDPVSAGHRRRSDGFADDRCCDRSAGLHVQPDQLQSSMSFSGTAWGTPPAGCWRARFDSRDLEPLPNGLVSQLAVQTELQGVNLGQDEP